MKAGALICIGQVGGIFGVKGWVKVRSHTSPITNILDYHPWQLETRGGWVEVTIEEGREHGKGIVARLPGCTGREDASRFVGSGISVSREQLPETEEDEYYWTDLIGLQVNTVDGVNLGHVARLIETGSNDVLVVKGDHERLVPLLWDSVVTRVETQEGYIVVDWDPEF